MLEVTVNICTCTAVFTVITTTDQSGGIYNSCSTVTKWSGIYSCCKQTSSLDYAPGTGPWHCAITITYRLHVTSLCLRGMYNATVLGLWYGCSYIIYKVFIHSSSSYSCTSKLGSNFHSLPPGCASNTYRHCDIYLYSHCCPYSKYHLGERQFFSQFRRSLQHFHSFWSHGW